MNKYILNTKVQEFIKNYSETTTKLAFSGSPFDTITVQELIQQIESRRKAENKLPSWYKTEKIYYPPKLNLEQTSSEITATYKAIIVKGKLLADITGGFGVDSYFFSKSFEKVHHFEIDQELSKIADYNFEMLEAKNIECFAENGLFALSKNIYDVIYADPSRRQNTGGKVFILKDCTPNIPDNLTDLLKNCKVLLLKTSPMLDITVGLSELKHVFEIHIVAVSNEVKELLWILKKDFEGSPIIKTINFATDKREIFDFEWDKKANAIYSQPLRFLYEPNAALMKSGAFELLSDAFKIKKIHKHTHLYTSESLREFPGRRFVIEKCFPYSKTEIKKNIDFGKANVATRNFPETVEILRKKWKIKEGGEVYLFFITDLEGKKQVLICSKV